MKKIIGGIILLLLVVALFTGYSYYKAIMLPNTSFSADHKLIQIPTGTNYEGLCSILKDNDFLNDISSFEKTAKLMKYNQSNIKPGQYNIVSGWNNRQLIQYLRRGKQVPIKLSFNNVRTMASLSGKICRNIELDSLMLLNYVMDTSNLSKQHTNKENIISKFTPNTYEVYWDISAESLMNKMSKETDKFWAKNNRVEKATKLGFTLEQVNTLASIVEKETQANVEKARIAGVYLNRIQRGIPLQADPTVVFALQRFDIKRVLLKHLKVDSPYNTYKNAGLPPGPIYMPSISSIDAVLNPESHRYLYFCARPDGSGQHAFAKNLIAHNKNARTYQRWLSKRGIR